MVVAISMEAAETEARQRPGGPASSRRIVYNMAVAVGGSYLVSDIKAAVHNSSANLLSTDVVLATLPPEITRRFQINHHTWSSPETELLTQRVRILQLSDLHVYPGRSYDRLRDAVLIVYAFAPDV